MKTFKYQESLEEVFANGALTGLVTFVMSCLTILYWKRDGFDFLEISFMSIIAGIYLFIIIIPMNIIFLNRGIRYGLKNDLPILKRVYQVLLSLIIGMAVFLLLDSIYFLVDNSISKDFAQSLKEMSEANGRQLAGIEEFASLPFGVQNGILTFVLGLLGSFISLAFIKRDGQLIKNQYLSV